MEKRTEKIKTVTTKYKVSNSTDEDHDSKSENKEEDDTSRIQNSDQKLVFRQHLSNNSNVEHVSDSEEEIL